MAAMLIRKTVAMAVAVAVGVCLFGATACKTVRQTEPPRTATEEMLVTSAAERALQGEDFSWLKGKRVFLEDKYFDSYDKAFVLGLLRQCFSIQGVLLEATNAHADLIVEVRSAALSINSSETLLGIPSTASPVPLAGAVQLPEIALYKSQKEDSIADLAL